MSVTVRILCILSSKIVTTNNQNCLLKFHYIGITIFVLTHLVNSMREQR